MTKRANKKSAGFVVTAELLLVTTILAIGLITGMTKLRDQTIAELSDAGSAIGSINQSFTVDGTNWTNADGAVSSVAGFAYTDAGDDVSGQVGGDGATIDYLAAPTPSTTISETGENTLN